MNKPECPYCKREMVYLLVGENGQLFKGWTCDCEYREADDAPDGIIAEIVRAREWDDVSIWWSFEEDKTLPDEYMGLL